MQDLVLSSACDNKNHSTSNNLELFHIVRMISYTQEEATRRYCWKQVFFFTCSCWHFHGFPCFTGTTQNAWMLTNAKEQVNIKANLVMFYNVL